jgi:hypothetical protein
VLPKVAPRAITRRSRRDHDARSRSAACVRGAASRSGGEVRGGRRCARGCRRTVGPRSGVEGRGRPARSARGSGRSCSPWSRGGGRRTGVGARPVVPSRSGRCSARSGGEVGPGDVLRGWREVRPLRSRRGAVPARPRAGRVPRSRSRGGRCEVGRPAASRRGGPAGWGRGGVGVGHPWASRSGAGEAGRRSTTGGLGCLARRRAASPGPVLLGGRPWRRPVRRRPAPGRRGRGRPARRRPASRSATCERSRSRGRGGPGAPMGQRCDVEGGARSRGQAQRLGVVVEVGRTRPPGDLLGDVRQRCEVRGDVDRGERRRVPRSASRPRGPWSGRPGAVLRARWPGVRWSGGLACGAAATTALRLAAGRRGRPAASGYRVGVEVRRCGGGPTGSASRPGRRARRAGRGDGPGWPAGSRSAAGGRAVAVDVRPGERVGRGPRAVVVTAGHGAHRHIRPGHRHRIGLWPAGVAERIPFQGVAGGRPVKGPRHAT